MEIINLNSDNAVFYRNGVESPTKQIGSVYQDNVLVPAVVRYSFTTPSSTTKSVDISITNWDVQYGTLIDFRFYIGTNPTSHIIADNTYEYTGDLIKQSGALFTASAEATLEPETSYYLWIFPIESTYCVLTFPADIRLTTNFVGTVNGTILGQIGFNGAWDSEYKTNSSEYAGYYNTPYVCIRKLEIPTIQGIINKLQVYFEYSRMISSDNKVVLRWALCTSEANRELYRTNPPVDVVDEYQVASGIHDFTGTETMLTIDAYGIPSNEVYYLILWGSIGAAGGSRTTLNMGYTYDDTLTVYYSESGRVYIDRVNASSEETVNCSMNGQVYNGDVYSVSSSAYVGRNSSTYYTYALKFTTPNFVGIPNSITFSIGAHSNGYSTAWLHYALCSSDENFNDYRNTTDMIVDDAQFSSGPVTFSSLSSAVSLHTFTIPSPVSLSPNTTYYLILWSNTGGGMCIVDDISHHKVVLEYTDTSIKFDMYEIYIEDGTNWYKYVPYIDNGTSWDIVG